MNEEKELSALPGPARTPAPTAILARLAKEHRHAADDLLDLAHYAKGGPHPGRCVLCYFRLAMKLQGAAKADLEAIRVWLEETIEVVGFTAEEERCLTMPVDLDKPSLEECCQDAMQGVAEDRVIQEPVRLEFAFRPNL